MTSTLLNFYTPRLLLMGQTPTQGGASPGPQGMLMSFAPLILIFLIFYFLLIRPQRTQQKKLQQMVGAMRKGDGVVTRAGIYGTIAAIEDNTVLVEIANNVRVKMAKDAIVHVTPAG